MTEIGTVLFELKNRPQDWELDRGGYNLVHKPSGIEFWIANGLMFVEPYHTAYTFSFLDKWRFWRASAPIRKRLRKERLNNLCGPVPASVVKKKRVHI